MMMEYITPAGEINTLYKMMLGAGHTLIAGATGSGKSTVMAGLIHTAIYDSPAVTRFIICDPKRVDMIEYADLPHVLRYATEPKQIKEALQYALDIMETRYDEMARRRMKEYNGSTVYVFIDEVADLLTDTANKRVFTPMIQRLSQLGRAAHVTLIMASQICLASVISTPIKANFSSRMALRTATAQDSRNIIEMKGAEQLPDPRTEGKAYGIWRHGADTNLCSLPRYSDTERQRLIDHWKDRRNTRKVFSLFGRKSA